MEAKVFSAAQIVDAEHRITATPGIVGNAIGEAKAVAHWCMRHHPAVERAQVCGTQLPWESEYRQFDQLLSTATPAERLLLAQEMHKRFSAVREEGEAEQQRQRQVHFDANVAHDLERRRAMRRLIGATRTR